MKLDQNLSSVHNKTTSRASKKNAYHLAGHVVSIYLRNRSKNLPSVKEYRKRNASGAVCDDPRIALGPGVLTEL